jgi:hypothetical protein
MTEPAVSRSLPKHLELITAEQIDVLIERASHPDFNAARAYAFTQLLAIALCNDGFTARRVRQLMESKRGVVIG